MGCENRPPTRPASPPQPSSRRLLPWTFNLEHPPLPIFRFTVSLFILSPMFPLLTQFPLATPLFPLLTQKQGVVPRWKRFARLLNTGHRPGLLRSRHSPLPLSPFPVSLTRTPGYPSALRNTDQDHGFRLLYLLSFLYLFNLLCNPYQLLPAPHPTTGPSPRWPYPFAPR
jgi:hypothetical protein